MHAADSKAGQAGLMLTLPSSEQERFAGDHGVNRLPPHFFIIKIKEIQSQDKNIIELWTEKMQFTKTDERTGAILPLCPRAASVHWQASHLRSLPWTAFGSEWS